MRISALFRLLRHLAYSLTLRCPHCHGTGLMRNPYLAHERCAACGLTYLREDGDFWGTVVLCYGLSGVVGLGAAVLLLQLGVERWETVTYAAAGAAVGAILLFFPLVKSLWIYLLYFTRGHYEEYRPDQD